MDGVFKDVKVCYICYCYKVDLEYGKGVVKVLGIDIN